MKKKILCIGHASYDITFPMKTFPKENTKNRVNKKIECGGGPASNACYLLGKWGTKPYFAGIVGKDIYGKRIEEEFKSVKVDTKFLEFSKKYETTVSMIITSILGESRTCLTYRNSKMKLSKTEIDIEPDIILIDGQEYELSLNMLKKYPEAISIIDAGRPTDEIIKLCKNVNYIVSSKDFAEVITGVKFNFKNPESFSKIMQKFYELFPGKNYVVTLGEKGCIYLDNDIVKYMPTYRMKVKDTTGAGDIFHGAFTYAISEGKTLEEAVKFGNIAGALSTRKIGGRYSVPSKKAVLDLYVK